MKDLGAVVCALILFLIRQKCYWLDHLFVEDTPQTHWKGLQEP